MEEQRKAAQTFVEIDDARCRSMAIRGRKLIRCRASLIKVKALPARRSEII